MRRSLPILLGLVASWLLLGYPLTTYAASATTIWPGDVITVTVGWINWTTFNGHAPTSVGVEFLNNSAGVGYTYSHALTNLTPNGSTQQIAITIPAMNIAGTPFPDLEIQVLSINSQPAGILRTLADTYNFVPTAPTGQVPEVPVAGLLPLVALLGVGGAWVGRQRRRGVPSTG